MSDRVVFETLYRETYRRTYALLLRMSGNVHLAEELTQEAYVRAWKSFARFRGESSFGTWMHAIAVRTAIDDGRRKRHYDELTEIAEVPARPRLLEQAIDLERAIAALPPGARHVLVLHDIAGYKHQEIAELLGITAGTAKSQLHRARQLIIKEVSHG